MPTQGQRAEIAAVFTPGEEHIYTVPHQPHRLLLTWLRRSGTRWSLGCDYDSPRAEFAQTELV